MNDLENSVMQMLHAYRTAALEKDVDGFMSLYQPRVRVFDTWGAWPYEGLPAWRKMIESGLFRWIPNE